MKHNTQYLTQGAIIAALYTILTHLQNLLLPGSASWAIQLRLSEALTVLAFFTPAAVPGLAIGCLVFNISYAAALPLDFLVGTLATLLAAQGMWLTRHLTIRGLPLVGLALPALFNALLVGWELTVYMGQLSFPVNALSVALGELAVVLVAGGMLYRILEGNGLARRMFHRM